MSAAAAFLRAGIDGRTWSATGRLPTTLELARSAGVSRVSMTRAIRQLVSQGVLTTRPKLGIHLSVPAKRPEPEHRVRGRVDTVKSELVRDVLVGGHGPRPELPSLKELQARYGVSFRTVKHAVDSLVAEGMLIRRERGYGLRMAIPGYAVKRMVFVVTQKLERIASSLSHARSFFYPELYALERECSLRNILLEVERFNGDATRLAHKPDTLGYCVDFSGSHVERELLSRLIGFGVPVVACLGTDVHGLELVPRHAHLVLLECSNELAGFQVGQFLIARGHQRVCFLSHAGAPVWARGRYDGVARAFRLAGMPSAVARATLPDFSGLCESEVERASDDWVDELLRRDHTAWVAADDPVATEFTIPALRRRGVVVGTDISLVGFNDQSDAFFESLTSYNFNADGLACAMLFYAQFPERYRRARRKGHAPVQLTGYIVDRGSVATLLRRR